MQKVIKNQEKMIEDLKKELPDYGKLLKNLKLEDVSSENKIDLKET